MFDLILRTMFRRKKHLILTTIIVALIFTLLLLQYFLYSGFQQGVALSEQRLGADVVVLPKEIPVEGSTVLLTGEPINVYLKEQDSLPQIERIPGVEQWTTQFFTQTLDSDCCSLEGENRLVGIDWDTDFLVKPWVREKNLQSFEGHVAIVGWKVPIIDPVIEILDETYTVVGMLEETGTSMDQTIFVPLEEARALTANSDTVLQYWEEDDPNESISAIFFKAEQGYNPDFLAYSLNQLPDVQVIRSSEVLQSTKESFIFIQRILVLFIGTTLLLGIIGLIGRYSGYVMERKRELGLMMALGTSSRKLRWWIFSETIFFALIGSFVGLLFTIFAFPWLEQWTYDLQRQPFIAPHMSDWLFGGGMVFVVIVVILSLASFIPGLQISRLWAGQAMNEGELE